MAAPVAIDLGRRALRASAADVPRQGPDEDGDPADGNGLCTRYLLKALQQLESPMEGLLSRLGRPTPAARQWPRTIRVSAGLPGAPDCILFKALLT